jgi:uncharacterized protein Yka (UPF0111/DUF47 family)
MGLGGTAKKLQKVADMAEDVYAKLTALREEVEETRETVETTAERTERLEAELAEQRALIDRLLEAQGVERAPAPEREGAVDVEDVDPSSVGAGDADATTE